MLNCFCMEGSDSHTPILFLHENIAKSSYLPAYLMGKSEAFTRCWKTKFCLRFANFAALSHMLISTGWKTQSRLQSDRWSPLGCFPWCQSQSCLQSGKCPLLLPAVPATQPCESRLQRQLPVIVLIDVDRWQGPLEVFCSWLDDSWLIKWRWAEYFSSNSHQDRI